MDLFISLLLAGCILAADHVSAVGNDRGSEKINIVGEDSLLGAYDPSVEYDDSGIGWLAYSAINVKLNIPFYIETHLAKSLDHGRTWTKISEANHAYDKILVINGKAVEGFCREETPTLLFDPTDPVAARRWKLFTAVGFSKKPKKFGELRRATSWPQVYIAYRYAATPEALSSAQEIPLFGSKYCKLPVCSAKHDLNDFSADLKNVVFYEEPGSLVHDGVIYLTLSAIIKHQGQKTILLSSADHGETWKYIGVLTSIADAKKLGFDSFTSSSLAEQNGRLFLLVSPIRQRWLLPHLEYGGIYIFEFEDISKGLLKKGAGGNLLVHKYVPPLSTRSVGGGQSEYNEQNTYGGIIMAQSDIKESSERFKIFNTGQDIAE
ncbi:hypothetical protein [Candidatus Velamenicoccus archaeovorus]|nr:hypothetical protein [Candidatus Velamenicoccus archaeovorus]